MKNGHFIYSSLMVIFFAKLIFAEDSFDHLEPLKSSSVERNLFSQDEVVPDTDIQRNEDAATEKSSVLPGIENTWEIIENTTDITTNDQNPLFPRATLANSEQNITGKGLNVLSKRDILETNSPYAEPDSCSSTWAHLQSSSCELEASKFGHHRITGLLTHEIFCESSKLLRYVLVAGKNLESELGLELLFDVQKPGEGVISLKRLLLDESHRRSIARGLMRLNRFIQSQENLEYLSAIVERCVPFVHIGESWSRLNLAVNNYSVHFVRFLQHLEHRLRLRTNTNADFPAILTEDIKAVEKETLQLIRERFFNRFEGSPTSLVESLFDQLLTQERFHPYFAGLKDLVNILRDFHSGYRASGFHHHIITSTRDFDSTFLVDLFSHIHRIPVINRILNNGQNYFASITGSTAQWFSVISKKLNEIPLQSFFSSPSEIRSIGTNTDTDVTSHETDDSSSLNTFSPNVFPIDIAPDYSTDSPATATGDISNTFVTDFLPSPTNTMSSDVSIDDVLPLIANTHPDKNNLPLPTIFTPSGSTSEITDSQPFSSSFIFPPSLENTPFANPTPLTNDATLSYPTSNGEVYNNFPFLTSDTNSPHTILQTDSPSSTMETTFSPSLENIVIPYSASPLPCYSSRGAPSVNAPKLPLISFLKFFYDVSKHPTIPIEEARDAFIRQNSGENSNYYATPLPVRTEPFQLQPNHSPLSEAYIKFLVERLYRDLYVYPRYAETEAKSLLNLFHKITNSRRPDIFQLKSLLESSSPCHTTNSLLRDFVRTA